MYSVLTRAALRSHPRIHNHNALRFLSTPPSQPPPPAQPTPAPQSLSLDFQPTDLPQLPPASNAEGAGERTGAKSSKNSLSSIERRRRYLGRIALGVLGLAVGVQVTLMGREWEEEELKRKRMVGAVSLCFILFLVFFVAFDRSSVFTRLPCLSSENSHSQKHHQQDGAAPQPASPIYLTCVF
jgi:hypothetical protein